MERIKIAPTGHSPLEVDVSAALALKLENDAGLNTRFILRNLDDGSVEITEDATGQITGQLSLDDVLAGGGQ